MDMVIDSHAHLEMSPFDRDRDQVVRRAKDAGVEIIVTVGTTVEDCRKALEITRRYPGVYAVIGIHPHEVKDIKGRDLRLAQGNGEARESGCLRRDRPRFLPQPLPPRDPDPPVS